MGHPPCIRFRTLEVSRVVHPLHVAVEVLLAYIGAAAEVAGEGPDALVLPLVVLQVPPPREPLPALGALEEALASAAADAVLGGNSTGL